MAERYCPDRSRWWCARSIFHIITNYIVHSGVAGLLTAQGGGQICRPFVLGFW